MTLFRLLAALMIALASVEARPQDASSLEGIWVSETLFSPSRAGTLAIVRDGSRATARLGDAETDFVLEGNRVEFALPGRGRFRGTLAEDGRFIRGFWIGPARLSDSTRPFASATRLRRIGADRWEGEVRPLEDSFTLYLRLFRDAEGALVAAFRNPDRGQRGGAIRFRVAREGGVLRLAAGTDQPVTLAGQIVDGSERLRFVWPSLDRTLDFTRGSPRQARGYFARPPGDPLYVYRPPEAADDGWTTGRGADVGLEEAALTALVRRIAAVDPAERGASLIHSVLVARRGRLVLEEYFYGFDRDTAHDLRSAGKTFASVLLGAAMRRGLPIAPETPAYSLLARRGPFANPDPRKARITLAHLLTHSAGLSCDDNDESSPGHEDLIADQREQPDWWRYTLDLPMAHEPGTRYAYCSANINLAGAALTEASGLWLPELFDRTLAEPLRFGPYHWNLMPNGEGYLGGGAYMRPRDLLKIGQLFLDGGVWEGERIVDAAWVARSTAPAIEVTPATTGLTPEDFSNVYFGGADGLAWHLGTVSAGGRSYRSYEASGNGGQILLVIPEVDLAVVFTAENYGQGGIWGRWRNALVGPLLVPALTGR